MSSTTKALIAVAAALVFLGWVSYEPGSTARKRAKEKADEREKKPIH